jgi:hypothetical protein
VTIDLCERHTTRDGRAVERVIDVDPTALFLALVRTPRVRPRVALHAARGTTCLMTARIRSDPLRVSSGRLR